MASFDGRSGANDRGLVASGTNHTNVVNATTADAGVEAGGDDYTSDDFFTPTYFIRRNAMEFDLTSIPAGSIITNTPTLIVKLIGISGDTNNMSFNMFHFTRGSAPGGAFVANDYDEAAGTASSTAKDITGLSGDQTFNLNAAAITYLQSKFGGYANFSSRISGDYAVSAPTGVNLVDAYKGTDGTSTNRPRLQFDYTPPEGGADRSYNGFI